MLYDWSVINRMRFHPEKCKILQIHNNEPLCTKFLPLANFSFINGEFIEFTDCQRDLGVLVNSRFKWDDHQQKPPGRSACLRDGRFVFALCNG